MLTQSYTLHVDFSKVLWWNTVTHVFKVIQLSTISIPISFFISSQILTTWVLLDKYSQHGYCYTIYTRDALIYCVSISIGQ